MKLSGTITALVTPFIDQKLDEKGLAHHIDWQITQGIDGLLLLGSTGESSTLSEEEQQRMIHLAVHQACGKVPVWVGTGSYCTRQALEKTKRAKELGATIALIVTPYYNKPTQEGIYRHFATIASQVDIPIVVYNVPSRCGTNIETATLLRLVELPNIVGVKEASGNILQAGDILHAIRLKRPDFAVFSGDDALTLPMMALGAVGIISVVSNLVPKEVVALVQAASQGRFDLARKIHDQLLPLYKMAFIETNPIPIKTALHLCGMPSGECRLPLCPMSQENTNALRQLLIRMQLLKEV